MTPESVFMVVTIVDERRIHDDCFEKRTEHLDGKVFLSLKDAEEYCAQMNHENYYDNGDDWRSFFAVRELEVK